MAKKSNPRERTATPRPIESLIHVIRGQKATTAADGLLPAGLRRIHSHFHTPFVAVAALAIVATGLTVLLQILLKKPPLLTSVYLANLTTYYWLSPYFLVCVGILLILRREGVRDIATASAAWVSMAAIIFVAIEMFRSPVDAGTTYLPYVAVVTIAAVALAFITTRSDEVKPAKELERR